MARKIKNDATEFFNTHNGEKHARIHELRIKRRNGQASEAENAEFEMMYAEETEWLKLNKIEFSPKYGAWIFKG